MASYSNYCFAGFSGRLDFLLQLVFDCFAISGILIAHYQKTGIRRLIMPYARRKALFQILLPTKDYVIDFDIRQKFWNDNL
jgi:hypothetical protein